MSRVIVAKYGAKWCGPCHRCNPDFAKIMDDYKDKKVDFYIIDIDEPSAKSPEKVIKCIDEISSIPYFAVFPADENEKKVSIVGWKESDLRLAIECALPKDKPRENESFIRPGTVLSSSEEDELDQYIDSDDNEDETYTNLPPLEEIPDKNLEEPTVD